MTNTESTIFRAAQEVFLEKGLDNASMGDIARQANISRPALNYYYRTKEALFRAILVNAIEEILPRIAAAVTSDEPLLAKASIIIDHYHQILLENPLLPRFFIVEIQRDPRALLVLLEKHSNVEDLLVRLQQRHAGELLLNLPPRAALAHFFTTLYGLLFFPFLSKPILDACVFNDDPVAFHEFVAGRKDVILRMLSALFKPGAACAVPAVGLPGPSTPPGQVECHGCETAMPSANN
ncbi:MAG: TetR/AcrR family transcriptional regulator [Puniceicoccales bacterium]|nr:TetR/AcrR family transcriptional regulator [Puniceicoccales bacterium]